MRKAKTYIKGRDYDLALDALDQSYAITKAQQWRKKMLYVMVNKAHAYSEINDQKLRKAYIEEMKAFQPQAKQVGDAFEIQMFRYWLGRLLFMNEDTRNEGGEILTSVAKQSQEIGKIEHEVRAKIALVQYLLSQGNLAEAKTWLSPLEKRIDTLPPEFAMLVCDGLWDAYLMEKNFDHALHFVSLSYMFAEQLESYLDMARALTNKARVLDALGKYEEAEAFYLQSLELKEKYGSATIPFTLNKYIANLKHQGKLKLATKYEAYLLRTTKP